MNLLVLAADYPDTRGHIMLMYIHTRNKFYVNEGHSVTVLNFHTNFDYVLDGVKVLSMKSFEEQYQDFSNFDLLINHAPNLRNHYKFLKNHNTDSIPLVFFFHGHEVMHLTTQYPEPYSFVEGSSKLQKFVQSNYDKFKIRTWRNYFLNSNQVHDLVFVSSWFKDLFLSNLSLEESDLNHRLHVIYNSIGKVWQEKRYNISTDKEYDFITIRSSLDGSKFAVDLVNKWAKHNPELKFLLIGRGEFFEHIEQARNITHVAQVLPHSELMQFIDKSKCALMPTRQDSQGVMSCELASYGIPLITSDIDINAEVFANFPNVRILSNESDGNNLLELKDNLIENYDFNLDKRYYDENTVAQEINLYKDILDNE